MRFGFLNIFGKRKNIKPDNLKPVIFLHIQKTAGSSIVDYARKYYSSVISHGDFMHRKPEEFEEIQFISGHFGYEFARYYIPKRYSFVFLRDPVERVISFYYYCRNKISDKFKAHRIARENDLEQFLELGFTDKYIRNRIANNQACQIACGTGYRNTRNYTDSEILELAINHLDTFSYIGFTETLKDDSDHIIRALGMPLSSSYKKINVNYERPMRNDISTSTLEVIDELTRIDRIVYDEAWSRRESKKISGL